MVTIFPLYLLARFLAFLARSGNAVNDISYSPTPLSPRPYVFVLLRVPISPFFPSDTSPNGFLQEPILIAVLHISSFVALSIV